MCLNNENFTRSVEHYITKQDKRMEDNERRRSNAALWSSVLSHVKDLDPVAETESSNLEAHYAKTRRKPTCRDIIYSPVWQLSPSKPLAQLQVKSVPSLVQVPPFSQGPESQGFTSSERKEKLV